MKKWTLRHFWGASNRDSKIWPSTEIRARTQGRQRNNPRVDISIGYGDIDEISIFANFENGFSESNFLGTAQLLTTCPSRKCSRHCSIPNWTEIYDVFRRDSLGGHEIAFSPFTGEREVVRSRGWHFPRCDTPPKSFEPKLDALGPIFRHFCLFTAFSLRDPARSKKPVVTARSYIFIYIFSWGILMTSFKMHFHVKDVDECHDGSANCHADATCTNTEGLSPVPATLGTTGWSCLFRYMSISLKSDRFRLVNLVSFFFDLLLRFVLFSIRETSYIRSDNSPLKTSCSTSTNQKRGFSIACTTVAWRAVRSGCLDKTLHWLFQIYIC